MAKEFVMVKDNAVIKADERLAAELRLRGYKEQGEAKAAAEAAATQPNPYTKEEVEAAHKQAEILEQENAGLRARIEELESEKAEIPVVPPAQEEDKAEEKAAPKKPAPKK